MERLKTLKEIRDEMVLKYLEHHENNRTNTAKSMGISIRTLRNYINEMRANGVDIPYGYDGNPNNKMGTKMVVPCEVEGMASNEERLYHAENPEKSYERNRNLKP